MRSRWTAYAALSTTLAAGVILKSLAQRPNFYSATVYLSQSSANLMILCNMVFVTACSFLILLQKFLYGPLRPIEIEQLYEKAWFAVTETCLAMTIFRGEIGAWFLVMFFSLLAGKVWGWIGEGRVEVLEQQQHNILAGRGARLFHTRLAASLALSVLFDMTMLDYVVGQVLHMARPDMMVMFGFEFAVLTVTSLSTATRYALNLVEIGIIRGQKMKRIENIRKERVDAAVSQIEGPPDATPAGDGTQPAANEDLERRRTEAAAAAAAIPIDEDEIEVEGWEGKGRWVFYLDLTTDFCKLVIYLSFFSILLIFYGLPLHIMRDVFLTCRSFIKRIGDFMRYRTATRDMNERYPDATEAEIGDNECIICREEMRPYVAPAPGAATDPMTERMRPKKLPCGHVLHFACLRSWLERQQICPTCRATVVPAAQAAAGAAPVVQGAAGRAQHPPNRGNGRPRVFQIGPLRIGVGAARGNHMFEDLQEQLANLNALPQPPPPPVPAPNGNGPQQYGFGIRWDGIRRRAQGHRTPRGSVQDHLDSVERQIQRELDSLQASMGELQALRDVQAQLARIRLARQGTALSTQQPAGVPNVPPVPRLATGTTVTGLAAQPQQGVLQAGSDQLPNGLTLPEGWTMMPLQPMQAQPIAPPVFQAPVMPPDFPGMAQMAQMFQVPQVPQMPQAPQASQVPQGPVVVPPEPQATPQPDAEPTLANILRETREVLRATSPRSEASDGADGNRTSDHDPLAETIRLQQEVAQSRERMAELTGQLRGIGQNLANVTAEGQAASNNTTRAPPPSIHTQSTSRQSQIGGSSPQTASSNIRTTPLQQQARQLQTREQTRPSAPLAQPVTSQLPLQQPSATSPTPQHAPQMSRSPPSTTTTAGNSRPMTGATVTPSRQLTPNSQTSNSSVSESRTKSPHRPTRSIGSSWGFSGIDEDKKNDDNDDEDEEDEDDEEEEKDGDTTDSDDDEDEESRNTTKTNGSSSRSNGANGGASAGTSSSRTTKGKNPTVEELVEDPD